MEISVVSLIKLLSHFPTVVIGMIIVVVFCICNIDKLLLFKAAIYGCFSKFSAFAKKNQLSNQVRGTILRTIKKNNLSTGNIIPEDLKVEWVNSEEKDVFIHKQQVIIRIKQKSNPNENLVSVISDYVNTGLLYDVKQYLNKDIMAASQLLMIRKILQNANKDALPYWDNNFLTPEFNKDCDLKENFYKLQAIDKNGMFVGILLNEFKKAGLSIYGEIEDPELWAESSEFTRFLYDIALGISNDPERLRFNRDYFKVSIFLTASDKTLRDSGIRPFMKAMLEQLDNGIQTIYIFGLGSKQEIAKLISSELNQDIRISEIKRHPYLHIDATSGRRINGVFYECSIFRD